MLLLVLMVLAAAPGVVWAGQPPARFTAERGDDSSELLAAEEAAWQAAVARVAPSVVRIDLVSSTDEGGPASGVVVSPDGLVLTSAHRFQPPPRAILVTTPDGAQHRALRLGTDHTRLLTLLKIEGAGDLALPEPSPPQEIQVGAWAIAVGRTLGEGHPNRSVGIVSALDRVWGRALQTDAKVSPANYGGPLIDVLGRVMGVLVPLAADGSADSVSVEWYDSGIGLAIPWSQALAVAPRLAAGEDLRPGVLGVSFTSSDLLAPLGPLAAVRPGSPAAKAGLLSGDLPLAIDGAPVQRLGEFKRQLGPHYAGDRIAMRVRRDGAEREVEIELVDQLPVYKRPWLGVSPRGQNPEGVAGLVIRQVQPDTPAAQAGLAAGDALVDLDQQPLADAAVWRQALGRRTPSEQVKISWLRDGKRQTAEMTLAAAPDRLLASSPPPAAADLPAPGDNVEAPPPPPPAELAPEPIELRLPEMPNAAWAWIPPPETRQGPPGVFLWLHGPEGWTDTTRREWFAAWQQLARDQNLALLLPQSVDPARWNPLEVAQLESWVRELDRSTPLDWSRVVFGGAGPGGVVAGFAARALPKLVRGLVLVEVPLARQPRENDPEQFLAVLNFVSGEAMAEAAAPAVALWREAGFPVDVEPLAGPWPGSSAARARLAAWLDRLDAL